MRRRTAVVAVGLVALFLVAVFAMPADTTGLSGGLTQGNEDLSGNPVTTVQRGCYCHGQGGNTDVTQSTSRPDQGNVTLSVEGVPAKYEGGRAYVLTVSISSQNPSPSATGPQGGFLMNAGLGTLAAVEGDATVQVNDLGEATHSSDGNHQREWSVRWTAPPEGSGDVLFMVAGNAVDGDNVNSAGDHWNTMTFVVLNSSADASPDDFRTYTVGPAQAEKPAEEEELGFFLRAYWIGLLGIGAMLLVIAVSYYAVKSTSRFHRDEEGHKKRGLP